MSPLCEGFFFMEISDNSWKVFKEWQRIGAEPGDRGRSRRGRGSKDPDSVIAYDTKQFKPIYPDGEIHHIGPLGRLWTLFATVETKEQLATLIDTLRDNGLALGNSWENVAELQMELHDSSNPESIHRQEQALGMDEPGYYLKEGASFQDALDVIPRVAQDWVASKRRIQDLQFRSNTIGDAIGGTFQGFTEAVLKPIDKQRLTANRQNLFKALGKGKRILPPPSNHSLGLPRINTSNFANRLLSAPTTPFELVDSATDLNPGVRLAKDLVQAANPQLDIKQDFDDTVAEVKGLAFKGINELQYMGNRLMQGKLPYTP